MVTLPESVVGVGKEARCFDLWQSPPDMEEDHLLRTKEDWREGALDSLGLHFGCQTEHSLFAYCKRNRSAPRLTDSPVLSRWDPKV